MTDEQKELCYTIKLELVKAIIDIKNEDMWRILEKVISEREVKADGII